MTQTFHSSDTERAAPNAPTAGTVPDAPATGRFVCFASGTWIDTPAGPVPVDALCPGREVTTQDNGARPLRWTGRLETVGAGTAAPVVFAPCAFGNRARLAVSQHHRILIRHPAAQLLFDCSEVWVPARALVNGTTIRIEPQPAIAYHHLLLDRHEILTANGIPAESLYLGDIAVSRLRHERLFEVAAFYPQAATDPDAGTMLLSRPALTETEGRVLAQAIGLTGAAGPALPAARLAA